MKSRERRLTKLRKENVNLPKFLTRKKNFVSVLEETIYALRDMSIKKRYRARIKKHYTSKGTFKKPYRNHLLKYSMKVARRQRKRNRRRRRLRKFGVGLKYNKGPLLNLLKRKVKFQLLEKDNFKKSRVYFKYTGSNIFLTITNSLGEVAFVYSAGIFKNSHTRKEKTTIFMAQQLGELLSVRIYKTNAKEIFFILFINHTKARVLVKFFMRGVKAVNRIKFNKVIFKRRVMRNGVRLAKPRRK
jgi:ribosomal protein S11